MLLRDPEILPGLWVTGSNHCPRRCRPLAERSAEALCRVRGAQTGCPVARLGRDPCRTRGRHWGQRAHQESPPGLPHKADLRAPVSLRAPASSGGKPVRPARALPPPSARAPSAPGDTHTAPCLLRRGPAAFPEQPPRPQAQFPTC